MLYKALNLDGTPCHGGTGRWHLPPAGRPGTWMPAIQGELIPCRRGYHLCRPEHLSQWLGPAIYEAEADGEVQEKPDKVVARQARLLRRVETWNSRTQRLFAADCAEHVLHLWEARYPSDMRPRHTIAVARRYARGEATVDELHAAADDAFYAATYASTYAATKADDAFYAAADASFYAAADASNAADASFYATAAASNAADAADAAYAAERTWQNARLFRYLRGDVS